MNLLTKDQAKLIDQYINEGWYITIGAIIYCISEYNADDSGIGFTLIDPLEIPLKKSMEYSDMEEFLAGFKNPKDVEIEEEVITPVDSPRVTVKANDRLEKGAEKQGLKVSDKKTRVIRPADIRPDLTSYQYRILEIVKGTDGYITFGGIKEKAFKLSKTHPSAALKFLVDNGYVLKSETDGTYYASDKQLPLQLDKVTTKNTKKVTKKNKVKKPKKVHPVAAKNIAALNKMSEENKKKNQALLMTDPVVIELETQIVVCETRLNKLKGTLQYYLNS